MNGINHNPLAPFTHNDELELRREPRLFAHLPSVLIDDDQSIYITIINLSSKGIGLLSAKPLNVGEDIEVKFEYKGNKGITPVTLQIHIIYCYEAEDEYYIGGSISNQPLEFTQFFYCSESSTKK